MTFIDQLEQAAAAEPSYFRGFLLREDVARLRQLQALAATTDDAAVFVKSGTPLGWTSGDLRTWELKSTLTVFLETFFAATNARDPAASLHGLNAAWRTFDQDRMDKLVGCLARVPNPDHA